MSDLKPVSVQLYSVREALAGDFEGTVRQIADMGYVGVEPYGGMPCELSDAAGLFDELDLKVQSSHVPFPDAENQDTVLAIAEAYDLNRVCIAFMPPSEFDTLDAHQDHLRKTQSRRRLRPRQRPLLGLPQSLVGIQADERHRHP